MGPLLLRASALSAVALLHAPAAPAERAVPERDSRRLEAVEYHVDPDRPRRVTFASRMPLESFEGVTDRVDGFVFLPETGVVAGDAFPSSRLHFEVALASLETGIRLRDRHMREEYLEVERFPFATFSGSVESIAGSDETDEVLRVTSSGTFAVHGVEREREIECDARVADPGYRVRCSFPVRLPDHDIDIPRVMFLKLAEEVRVDLDLHLRPVEGDR